MASAKADKADVQDEIFEMQEKRKKLNDGSAQVVGGGEDGEDSSPTSAGRDDSARWSAAERGGPSSAKNVWAEKKRLQERSYSNNSRVQKVTDLDAPIALGPAGDDGEYSDAQASDDQGLDMGRYDRHTSKSDYSVQSKQSSGPGGEEDDGRGDAIETARPQLGVEGSVGGVRNQLGGKARGLRAGTGSGEQRNGERSMDDGLVDPRTAGVEDDENAYEEDGMDLNDQFKERSGSKQRRGNDGDAIETSRPNLGVEGGVGNVRNQKGAMSSAASKTAGSKKPAKVDPTARRRLAKSTPNINFLRKQQFFSSCGFGVFREGDKSGVERVVSVGAVVGGGGAEGIGVGRVAEVEGEVGGVGTGGGYTHFLLNFLKKVDIWGTFY